tara:strand:- start:117 stop:572 length:456 start_codon:yes stop_codon:yes gene_type:complete
MDFFKNIWKSNPKLVMYIGGVLILIGFVKTLTYEVPTTSTVSTPKTNEAKKKLDPKMKLQEDIKYMKACGKQLRINRVNWYLDEKGITDNFERLKVLENTDLYDSSKPYELMESYKAMGIQPKTGRDLPYFNCVPDAKDKLPKELLEKFGY